MTYLEEAAEQLRKARSANEARAGSWTSWLTEAAVPVLTEVNQRRMEIADGFIRLAAIERSAQPEEPIFPHELELRIADALSMAARYQVTDGEHHKTWIVDQVVRRLTGCLDGGVETAEYLRFREEEDDWDEGITP